MKESTKESLWEAHSREWRHPAEALSFWSDAGKVSPGLLEGKAYGQWWEVIEKLKITLLATREYEHLIQSFSMPQGNPRISYLRLPHPSGLAFKPDTKNIYVACTRNPNQVFELSPSTEKDHLLIPTRSWFYPGKTYIHDLAFIGGHLHANAVGQNAVIRLEEDGSWQRVWWPHCLDKYAGAFDLNYLQLNSIAAGKDLQSSFFSASVAAPSSRRPGHLNFPVDGRGVIFSGETKIPIVSGLTRPHSARLFKKKLWVNNSGYGTFGTVQNGSYKIRQTLPGWTRGLSFCQDVVFVGTSRVLPRFQHYAPGLNPEKCCCGIHALDLKTGDFLGSYLWPQGNQIFALEWIPSSLSSGFPFYGNTKIAIERTKRLFYNLVKQQKTNHAKF
ncbi:MAG: DUF4915 domain-containing protein [Blastochloris sp.]|jgi:uncharacterized protein (TIGR03032 family)|nr:DUF4915 domain-containing protein [Blastochloris sp.]